MTAKKFSTLREKMPPDARAASEQKAKDLSREIKIQEMALQELRRARKISQEQMAKALHTRQSSVSRLEKRTDMYISTLRGVIEAMGGELKIVAKFPDGDVTINQFEDLGDVVKA